nr:MFS transporter [Candidatus Sigynarchaeum springense]
MLAKWLQDFQPIGMHRVVLGMAKPFTRVTVHRAWYRGGGPVASVYYASFTKVLFSNLYSIAVSNILIFMLGASSSFLGIATALNALAYFAGPLLFQGLSRRAGIKRTIFTISIADLAMMILAASIPLPSIIVAVFIISGFSSCIFWANMATAVRAWQDETPEDSHGTIYRRYVISWIGGGLASELIGILIIATGFDDRLVLAISIAIAFVQLPISHHVSLPHSASKSKEQKRVARVDPGKVRSVGRLLVVPVCLMLIAELSVQMIKGTYDFLYPFVIRDDGGSTGWIYLMSLMQRFAYMSGMFMSSKLGTRGQHTGAMMGLGIATMFTVHSISFPIPIMFTFTLVISEFATGLIYGYSSQALLRYGEKRNALRLASLYETASGAGYGVMVIIAGFGGDHDVRPIFIGLSAFLALAFASFALAAFKVSSRFRRLVNKIPGPSIMPSGNLFHLLPITVRMPVAAFASGECAYPVMLLDTAKK